MSFELLLGLLLGILAYSFLYLAKGIEKYAIEGIKEVKTLKSKNSFIWIIGVLFNAIYMFVQWEALKHAPISLIAPLNGFGLVVLLIFSYYVLKEMITKIEVLGAVLIMAGTVIIPIFNSGSSNIEGKHFSIKAYILFIIIVIGTETFIVIYSKRKKLNITGVVVGLTAGTYFAFETVSKRITAIPDERIKIVFTILTMLISVIGFLFTQYALVKEKANIAVPCFTSTSVIFATLIGAIFLGEKLNLGLNIGSLIIIIGIIMLTASKGQTPLKNNKFN